LCVAAPVDQRGAELAGGACLTCLCRGGQWSGWPGGSWWVRSGEGVLASDAPC
jgi:hypothetical protein